MARLIPVSGSGAKGPACFVVETGDKRLMLDLGYGPQPGVWPNVDLVGQVDALLLSHGHRDHAGGLELAPKVGQPAVYATSTVLRSLSYSGARHELPQHGATTVAGVGVRTGRSGHAPGGIWLHLDLGGGLLYMGDSCVESLIYAHDAPPRAETLIVDASYGDYDVGLGHCIAAVDAVIAAGPVLFPVPENGRGPEIALHAARLGALPHLDDTLRQTMQRLATGDRESIVESVRAELSQIAAEAPPIQSAAGVMLASRADGAAGAAAGWIARWQGAAEPAIVFTGYLPPGTPAETLTRAGRARYLRWNVHPRLSDNATLVQHTVARRVVPAFGDARHLTAWQHAFSPARVVLDGPIEL